MPQTSETPADSPLEPLIFSIRGHRVILDADLARLYGVTTSILNQALRRNHARFPSDFAFQLTPEEIEGLRRSQPVIASGAEAADPLARPRIAFHKFRNPRFLPWVFTEHGALMAANVLHSEKAALMSIYVVRLFVKLRQTVLENEAMSRRMAEAELSLREHDAALSDIYEKLEPLLEPPPEEPSKRIMGFRREDYPDPAA